MRRPTSILLVALATSACTCQEPPAPAVTAVEPAQAPADVDTLLVVRGANLLPAVQADLDDPGRSQVDAGFVLELVGPAGERVALVSATLVSEGELRATLPGGASPETYDLRLVDPRGRAAVLEGALLVYVPDCAGDGTPCEDGDACTVGDVCQARLCRPGAAVACTALDACHLAGACDPGTGLCSSPLAPDGSACRSACAAGETCQAGVCTLPPGGCLNTAPLARLSVTPLAVTPGASVTFDASGSADAEEPTSALTAEFDFEGSGVFSAPRQATQPASHAFTLAGPHEAWVRVTDSSGLTSYASALVVVVDAADRVAVTTADDESDPGATPDVPGHTGLSLREAVAYVNLQPTPKTITFAGPLAVVMKDKQRFLTLTAPYTTVVGGPGVTVDFGGYNQACFRLTAPGQRLLGLAVRGCDSVFVQLIGSPGAQVAYCDIGPGPSARGVYGQSDSPPGGPPASLIGPGNLIAGLDIGVWVEGTDYVVAGNRVSGNASGVVVNGVRSRVIGNAIFGQVVGAPGTGNGLRIYNGPGPVEVWHNVLDGNGRDGLQSDTVPLDVRNNLFTGNAGHGVLADAGSFAPGAFGWNGYFGNAMGAVTSYGSPPLATQTTDVLADPLYVDRPAADFRLLPGSPAVDAGIAIPGLDVNGPAPGNFDHLAPDLGFEETPY